jgi:hypothetical protein
VVQDEPADCRIERSIEGNPVDVTLDEVDIAKTARGGPFSRERDGRGIPFDADDCSGITDESRRKHRDVACAATEVEHALAGADAGIAKTPLGNGRQQHRLRDQSIVFCAAVAKDIRGSHVAGSP